MRWLLALTLVGCGQDLAFHGDLAFTAEERSAIETGARFVAERTQTPVVEIVWDGDMSARNTIRKQQPLQPEATGSLTAHDGTDLTLSMRPGFDVDSYRVIAAHEFGHYRGMQHHDGPGLMNLKAEDSWTGYDQAECQRVRLCDKP